MKRLTKYFFTLIIMMPVVLTIISAPRTALAGSVSFKTDAADIKYHVFYTDTTGKPQMVRGITITAKATGCPDSGSSYVYTSYSATLTIDVNGNISTVRHLVNSPNHNCRSGSYAKTDGFILDDRNDYTWTFTLLPGNNVPAGATFNGWSTYHWYHDYPPSKSPKKETFFADLTQKGQTGVSSANAATYGFHSVPNNSAHPAGSINFSTATQESGISYSDENHPFISWTQPGPSILNVSVNIAGSGHVDDNAATSDLKITNCTTATASGGCTAIFSGNGWARQVSATALGGASSFVFDHWNINNGDQTSSVNLQPDTQVPANTTLTLEAVFKSPVACTITNNGSPAIQSQTPVTATFNAGNFKSVSGWAVTPQENPGTVVNLSGAATDIQRRGTFSVSDNYTITVSGINQANLADSASCTVTVSPQTSSKSNEVSP